MDNEQTNADFDVRKMPYQHLMEQHNLVKTDLSNSAQQLIADLNRTINLVVNSGRENVNITPKTENKIKTYDRYICDGIFEYLEDQEQKEVEVKTEEDQKQAYTENQETTETVSEEKDLRKAEDKSNIGLGFWEW